MDTFFIITWFTWFSTV